MNNNTRQILKGSYFFYKMISKVLTVYVLLLNLNIVLCKYLISFQSVSVGSPVHGNGTCNAPGSNSKSIISLGNCFNNLYTMTLSLGSNLQVFTYQVDTGSNTMWIPLQAPNITGFNPSTSTSFTQTNQSQLIQYADNSQVSGNLNYDIINAVGTPLNVTAMFLGASQVSQGMFPTGVQGLIGFGYTTQPNILDVAYAKGLISTPVFTLQLLDQSLQSNMFYNNGETLQIKNNIIWINQYQTGHWQVDLIGVTIGGIDYTTTSADAAVIDSGTSLFYLNYQLFTTINAQFFSNQLCYLSSGFPTCPCNISSSWPSFSFMFIGIQVFIVPSQYTSNLNNGYCQATFSYLSSVNSIILGDTFFRKYVISFDKLNSRIGFYGPHNLVYVVGEDWFKQSQIVMAILFLLFAVIGVIGWLWDRRKFTLTATQNLGREGLNRELIYF